MLFPGTTIAQERQLTRIIIAADHSNSMHTSGNIHIQTNAFTTAIETYLQTCNEVQLTYIAWGSNVPTVWSFVLSDRASREQFTTRIQTEIKNTNMGQTVHLSAWTSSIRVQATDVASNTAIIVITDQIGTVIPDTLPQNVYLFKIALGSPEVERYMRKDFIPNQGRSYHAADTDELRRIITEVFLMMGSHCLG